MDSIMNSYGQTCKNLGGKLVYLKNNEMPLCIIRLNHIEIGDNNKFGNNDNIKIDPVIYADKDNNNLIDELEKTILDAFEYERQ